MDLRVYHTMVIYVGDIKIHFWPHLLIIWSWYRLLVYVLLYDGGLFVCVGKQNNKHTHTTPILICPEGGQQTHTHNTDPHLPRRRSTNTHTHTQHRSSFAQKEVKHNAGSQQVCLVRYPYPHGEMCGLTHWGRDKMDAIPRTTFS